MNILRAMSVVTIFALAATVSMAPDGFDMSAGTLGTFSAYVFAALFLWFGAPLWLAIVLTIVFTMVMYLLTMFLILVCKIPDMLATCALQFVHAGLGLAFTGGSAVSAGLSAPKWFGALHGGDVTPLRKGWTTGSMGFQVSFQRIDVRSDGFDFSSSGFLCRLLFSNLCSKVNGCFYGLGLVLASFGTGHKGHLQCFLMASV